MFGEHKEGKNYCSGVQEKRQGLLLRGTAVERVARLSLADQQQRDRNNSNTDLNTSQMQSVSRLQTLANHCRYVRLNRTLFPTPATLLEMVGCLVS